MTADAAEWEVAGIRLNSPAEVTEGVPDMTGNVGTVGDTLKIAAGPIQNLHLSRLPVPDISIRRSGKGAKPIPPQPTNHYETKTSSPVQI